MDQIGPNEALFWVNAELPVPKAVEVKGEAVMERALSQLGGKDGG